MDKHRLTSVVSNRTGGISGCKSVGRYAALWVLSYAVSTLALIGLIEHAGMNAIVSKVIVEAGIVVMNFLVMKALIFHPRAGGIGE